ncbi:MAG: PorP/SprF family type IX secretion system membrane protein [Paludibacteraceae bacterium]|nr:PorP/SprF family type IX secretion system membrane protein [Paludibacteraceae bacterium]
MKKILTAISLLAIALTANAQRDMMLSQQFFSRLNINPAATGNSDDIDLFLLGRWQWTNVEDAPKSGVLNVSDYFEGIRSGIGLSMLYDDIGISNRTYNCKAAYAYHVNLNESMLLSMGLSAGIYYHYWNPEGHRLLDPEEYGRYTFPDEVDTHLYPDFDLGFELATPKLMIGGSVSHLTNNEEDVTTGKPGRHMYSYVRGLFPIGANFDIAPALVYLHRNKVDKVELNAMLFYKGMLWGGVTYRPDVNAQWSSNDLTFQVGIDWSQFRFGYSFELGLGEVGKLSNNSHDILISWRIPKAKKEKYVRFME